jgi:hexosaminidase
VRTSYDWEPADVVEGIAERDILGVEELLWSETIDTRAGLDWLAFPRLLGVAEAGWSQRGRTGARGASTARASPSTAPGSTRSAWASTAPPASPGAGAAPSRSPEPEP